MLQGRRALPLTATSVAFVGSHRRLTGAEVVAVQLLLRSLGVVEVHHGDGIGADQDVHRLADELRAWRIVHPAQGELDPAGFAEDIVLTAKRSPQNHRDMVDAAGVLIVALGPVSPGEGEDDERALDVVRYARAQGKTVVVVAPSGEQRWL